MEFRIEGGISTRNFVFRLLPLGVAGLLFVMPFLLIGLGIFGIARNELILGRLFKLSVFVSPAGALIAIVLGCREALRWAEREMVFVLDDHSIVKKRKGYPDVKIPFSEIEALFVKRRWLVVVSDNPIRKIAVPNNVQAYESIRAELTRHHALSVCEETSMKSAALLTSFILSWGVVLLFRDMRVVITAGAIALITLAFASRRLWTLLHRGPKLLLLWISLGVSWAMAFLVIYIRVAHP